MASLKKDKYLAQAAKLIVDAGGVLQRSKTHWIFEMPGGKKVSLSKSPSTRRGSLNKLAQVKRFLAGQSMERGDSRTN